MTTFVLVHGAWHGGWCWERVAILLRDRGFEVRAVEQLASSGTDPAALGDLRADAERVRTELDRAGEDVVLVGHSYGGMAISEVAGHPAVRHAVYLAAFWAVPGRSTLDMVGGRRSRWQVAGPHGSLRVDPDRAIDLFYADCDPADARAARDRLVYQSAASFAQPSATAGWGAVPVTYVVASQDRCVPPPLQRQMGAAATRLVEIDSSHSPFLSRPAHLADVLAEAGR